MLFRSQAIGPPENVGPPDDYPEAPTDLFFDHRIVRTQKNPVPEQFTWMRVDEDLGSDPMVHACALAYMSDEDLLGVAALPHRHGGNWDTLMCASLDHAVWFHRPVRATEWLLFALSGHGVANARGMAVARVFTESGEHVATVAQEGLVRVRR